MILNKKYRIHINLLMNPFSITKDFRKKKQRKKSTDEDPNLVFKSTFETKAKVFVIKNYLN